MQREPADWTLRGARRKTNLVCVLRQNDGRTCRALVTNLSYEGCTLIPGQELATGETWSLELPNQGAVNVQVRWVKDQECGIRFLLGGSPAEERRARLGF
jgi:PilZ domain